MPDLLNILALLIALGSLIVSGVNALTGRQQTRLMVDQAGKRLEVQLINDLNAPDDAVNQSQLQRMLNTRLERVRTKLRGEYEPRLDSIEKQLDDAHIQHVLEFSARAFDLIGGEMTIPQRMEALEQNIRALQRAGDPAQARAQLRAIGEQLIRMTSSVDDPRPF